MESVGKRQKLKLCKPVVRTSKKWTSEAVGELQGCLDCTDWDVFRTTTNSLDEYTDTVSSYIYFCEDSIIPTCTRATKTFSEESTHNTNAVFVMCSKARTFYMPKATEQTTLAY
ncbi:hypothetical protein QTP70_013014 [Hemibagrus guttatus]|uniref:Uncharacterized protein n=1 Tax=Hemibagrus guttatus TaxID=175788 RepID=A0AAE0R4T7_9TELE|nr:hypothetical protein QTP70_013014 [Hemibagrus guttatus]